MCGRQPNYEAPARKPIGPNNNGPWAQKTIRARPNKNLGLVARIVVDIRNPHLVETDNAKVVSLLLYLHSNGPESFTVDEHLVELDRFKEIWKAMDDPSAKHINAVADPEGLTDKTPGIAF